MKTIAPNYYRHFACIAGACRHSCCIGWEIGIDKKSLARYQALHGEIGLRLRQNIDLSDDGSAHFRLQGDQERCPMLNSDGLCDLILTCGEDILCQICTDHPRYRHFWADRVEIGLGLCCEEAARLILTQEEPVQLEVIAEDSTDESADPEERALLDLREKLFALMQDRSRPVEERVKSLLSLAGAAAEDFVWSEWIPVLLDLERLDEHWADLLRPVQEMPALPLPPLPLQLPLEQLMVYLLHRHLSGAAEDGDVHGRILLCCLLWLLTAQLCVRYEPNADELAELCRLLSSEIEYSEDNIAALLNEIDTRFAIENFY